MSGASHMPIEKRREKRALKMADFAKLRETARDRVRACERRALEDSAVVIEPSRFSLLRKISPEQLTATVGDES